MKSTIGINQINSIIEKELKDWSENEVTQAVNKAAKETAAQGAKKLREGGPYTERSGKYTGDWSSKLRKDDRQAITKTENYTVYNKKHYQLAHLLEKGHLARDGSRVKPFEHILPVEEQLEKDFIANFEKRI